MEYLYAGLAILLLGSLYIWAVYHMVKADRCYRRIEIAEKAIEAANRSEHAKIKVYRLIERAKQASYNQSTSNMVNRLMEKYNQKFNHERHPYEEAYLLD